jgi:uncharacterized membrane protein
VDIYFSFQAALFFSIAHILIRRGLVSSNAITGSFISLSMTAGLLWLVVPFLIPLTELWQASVLFFVIAGIFAPGIGRTLSYLGIERIGVARSVPIVNSSPIFASIFAVFFLGEQWAMQNIAGTLLVIAGVVMLSMAKPPSGEWRKVDVIFPILGAISFGVSTTLRKAGLGFINIPLAAAACTAATGFLFSLVLLKSQGGRKALKLSRNSAAWFICAGIFNTSALLSVFHALSHGKVVIVEPLVSSNPVLTLILTAVFLRDLEALNWRVIIGALLAVAGTILVVLGK